MSKRKKDPNVQIPHSPNMPLMVTAYKVWYPVVMARQGNFLSKQSRKKPVPIDEGHVVNGGGSLLCSAVKQEILERNQAVYDAKYAVDLERAEHEGKTAADIGDPIRVFGQTFDAPKTSRMCENCKRIYKKMTDWTRWKQAVEDYQPNPEDTHVKPNRKKSSTSTARRTANKRGGANSKKNATKAKKRVPSNRKR